MVLLERSNWTTGDVGLNIHDERTHLILKQVIYQSLINSTSFDCGINS